MSKRELRFLFFPFLLSSLFSGISVSQDPNDPVSAKLGIKWILVEGGEMGDFYIAATEVTFDQFDAFCDATGRAKPEDTYGRGKQPVVNVNVPDAEAFCAWLSKQTGSTVRMPTSEEWVYAAEGGNKSEDYLFSGASSDADEVSWNAENSDDKNHEVATRNPNELGIYDMSGNVWEMCPASNEIHGGSSASIPQHCFTTSSTEIEHPNEHSAIVGFRVLKEKKKQP
jgi:hypothetical protein